MPTYFSSLHRTGRSLGLVTVGVLSTLGALSLSHIGPVQAQSPGINLAALVAQVNTLQSKLTTDESTIASQGTTITSLQSDVKTQGNSLSLQISTLKTQLAADEKVITSQGRTIISLNSSITDQHGAILTLNGQVAALQYGDLAVQTSLIDLQTRTASLSVSGTDLIISGVNVNIVNGMGATNTANGLGNLILGYNESTSQFYQARTGSHNLVVGSDNNYTYYGGIVAGHDNAITAPFACVVGGELNVANGSYATVSGGSSNTAVGLAASVSGGELNTASGIDSSVSGGYENTASGTNTPGYSDASSVSGGSGNTASTQDASVSGGHNLSEGTTDGWKAGSQSRIAFSTEGNFESD